MCGMAMWFWMLIFIACLFIYSLRSLFAWKRWENRTCTWYFTVYLVSPSHLFFYLHTSIVRPLVVPFCTTWSPIWSWSAWWWVSTTPTLTSTLTENSRYQNACHCCCVIVAERFFAFHFKVCVSCVPLKSQLRHMLLFTAQFITPYFSLLLSSSCPHL